MIETHTHCISLREWINKYKKGYLAVTPHFFRVFEIVSPTPYEWMIV
jgi:hypothetical protein